MFKYDLQIFATGDNQNEPIRTYIPQFHNILTSVYKVKNYWSDFFTNLQVLDGISYKDLAFSIKTDDVAAVVTDGGLGDGETAAYDTGANVAFGSGTGSTNRFGQRTEVKYTDVDVKYTWDWKYHEGIDKFTVNEDFDAAQAREMEKIAGKITGKFNKHQGAFLSANAGKTVNVDIASADVITSAQAISIFNQLDAYLTDIEVDESLQKVAAVTPALYNAIVDNNLSTTAKGSDVDIDRNEVRMFKDFVIRKIPTGQFAATTLSYKKTTDASCVSGKTYYTKSGDVYSAVAEPADANISTYYEAVLPTQEICIAGIAKMGVPFTGIETARAFEAHDFNGTALQGCGKSGEFISNDNKKALVKVVGTVVGA